MISYLDEPVRSFSVGVLSERPPAVVDGRSESAPARFTVPAVFPASVTATRFHPYFSVIA